MPQKGYANPITNDGPGFHSNLPVSELTERVTQAIEASDVNSTPPVAKTADGVNDHEDKPTPDRTPATRGGTRKVGLTRRPNARSQNDGSDPKEGVRAKTKNNVYKIRDAFSY